MYLAHCEKSNWGLWSPFLFSWTPVSAQTSSAGSQVPLEVQRFVPDVLKENLASLLHDVDQRPETSGPTTAVPELLVCVERAQKKTLQTPRVQHGHRFLWKPVRISSTSIHVLYFHDMITARMKQEATETINQAEHTALTSFNNDHDSDRDYFESVL